MKKLALLILVFIGICINYGCKKKGCTDPSAVNYNSNAKKDNGSCKYEDTTVVSVERISYGTEERQHFDLYLPIGHNSQTKTVIMIHGGAWVLGPQAQDSVVTFNGGLGWDIVNPLLSDGYAVAVMKYRLACYTSISSELTGDPNFYMNDMIEDVDLTIQKLKTEAGSLGISSNNFALIGESAGAQIALIYALRNSSNADLKTVVSFYSPALMDDQSFKNATGSFPYNSIPLSNEFGMPKYANSCNFTTTGNVNLFWGLKSLAGYNLQTGTAYPAYTDTLSPGYLPNIQRNLPTFILHGAADDLVPPAHADTLIDRITSVFGTSPASSADFAAQHKMLKYSNCGHGWNGGSCNRTQMIADVRSWLAAHF